MVYANHRQVLRSEPVDPVSYFRELARRIPLPEEVDSRIGLARSFCHQIVISYWRGFTSFQRDFQVPSIRPAGLHDLPRASFYQAEEAGLVASLLPKPLAAYSISSLYSSLLPDDLRADNGVYFTPPALVERLLTLVEESGFDWTTGTILDPAAGGGAFIAPIAERIARTMLKKGYSSDAIINSVAQRLAGIELDPFSGWMSQAFTEIILSDHIGESRERVPRLMTCVNALTSGNVPPSSIDLVIGNPPYGKARLPIEVRARYDRSLYGHANTYGLFTDFAVGVTRPGGIIAFVTPTSFLGGQYFKNLRSLLVRDAAPTRIEFISDRSGVFGDVLQETLLAVYRRGHSGGPVRVGMITPTSVSKCSVSRVGSVTISESNGGPWVLPRTNDHLRLLQRVTQSQYRLADYGIRVSTGPLVWNRHKHQLVKEPAPGRYPLVWAESVIPAGIFRFGAERRNHLPFFEPRPGQEHLLNLEPCVLVQRTTAKEQRRRLIAALLPRSFLVKYGAVVVENHLNVIRPTRRLSVTKLTAIAALLNSDIVDQIFRCINGSVAVSAYELQSLPVPKETVLDELSLLLKTKASREDLNSLVAKAYGLGIK